jgi:uncharacterized protein YkuJ
MLSASFSTIHSIPITKSYTQQINNNQESESHVISDVPYAEKTEGFSCDYAPLEMVFRYYNINITATDIFYTVGGGYGMGYGVPLSRIFNYPFRKLPLKFICACDRASGGTEDYKFLANLYGCTFDYIDYNLVKNKEKCWNEFWGKVKFYVANNKPVIVTVDPYSWPPFREFFNITTPPSIFARSCCVIVVVGYNETNNTICFNDQYIGEDKGKYQWIGIDAFKTAVGRPRWEMKEMRYSIFLLQKSSDPLPQETIIDLIHKRNINKMIGLKETYDSDFIQENFQEFGIAALESFKYDLEHVLIHRIPFYKIFYKFYPSIEYPFSRMIKYLDKEALNNHQIATYMLENENISKKYYYDAILLESEALYWENLSNLTTLLKDIVFTNPIHEAVPRCKSILNDMCSVIDDIIMNNKLIISLSNDN